MTTVTLFGFPGSTYTRTARIICEEAGVGYALQPLAFKQPSHFALHPFGKMPVLQHDGITLFESAAIAAYVDDVFNQHALQPSDAAARARMWQWISAAVDYVYRDVVSALLKDGEPADDEKSAARERLTTLDKALAATPFLAGENLTLADLVLFPMVDFATAKLGTGALDGLKNLARWRKTIAQRPAVKRTAD